MAIKSIEVGRYYVFADSTGKTLVKVTADRPSSLGPTCGTVEGNHHMDYDRGYFLAHATASP